MVHRGDAEVAEKAKDLLPQMGTDGH
ncbi:MAG: hypothetical protein JWL69_2694, partial [Phycisphaerales bacterium]|nr:hypothetical protein [Phycisphaerales bacterium]